MKPELNESVKYLIKKLESAGQRADIVGGCVRDFLLGKEPNDFDITTSATPDEMREIFRDEHTLEVGLKHGTLTVIIDRVPYEITTYRIEGDYVDHRHPGSVSFSRSLTDDLSRRDFTVNAICYSDTHGFTDPFGGMGDINKRVLRAVGDPHRRFEEDALRILRALRFSSTLGFEIEADTARAIRDKMHLLDHISAERIQSELKKLLEGACSYGVISDFPELIAHALSLDEGIKLIPKERFLALSPPLRLLALFATSATDPAAAFVRTAAALRLDNATTTEGQKILTSLGTSLDGRVDVNLSFMNIGIPYTLSLIRLLIALDKVSADTLTVAEALVGEGVPYRISDLAIGGDELIAMGIKGREIGELLKRSLLAVIGGECDNTREALLSYLNSHG